MKKFTKKEKCLIQILRKLLPFVQTIFYKWRKVAVIWWREGVKMNDIKLVFKMCPHGGETQIFSEVRKKLKIKKNFNSVKMVFLSKIISSQIFKIPSRKKYVYFQMYRGNASQ